jgi:DNA invertase Pin-like site-specific DNA recombinase
MIYGYARVSTQGQAKEGNGLEVQEDALKAAGAEQIYKDVFTGTKANRPEFDKLRSIVTDGDTIIVMKLDRIARSVRQGIEFVDEMNAKYKRQPESEPPADLILSH